MSTDEDRGIFARKLNYLFQTVRKPDGSEYTEADVEVGTAQQGERVTHNYIYRLRKGLSQNPSFTKIKALASFFGVSPNFFFTDDDQTSEADTPSSRALHHLDLHSLALRAEKIDDEEIRGVMLDMLTAIEQVRQQAEEETQKGETDS